MHSFDSLVFPQYRRRGFNSLLVNHMLSSLANEGAGRGRAYMDVDMWNSAQLATMKKKPYRYLGCARKFAILRRTIVSWDEKETLPQENPIMNVSMGAINPQEPKIPR